MKKLIIPIILAVTLGLTVYNTFNLGRIRCVTTSPTIVQTVPVPQQSKAFTDFLTVNTLELNPVLLPSASLREGMIWFDAGNDAIRMWGGDYPEGMEIPRGRYVTDVLTFNAGVQDTLEFPELIDLGRVVQYTLRWDSVNSPLVTFTLEDKMTGQHDTLFTSMSSSIFPYTIPQKYTDDIRFVCDAVQTDNRAIIDWDTAGVGEFELERKIYIMAKD